MKLSISAISQRDVRWKTKKLGTSSVTVGNYGCLLTCLSMLLKYYGHEQDPEVLNELFKANGVYSNGNLVKGAAVNKVYTDIHFDEQYECPNTPCDLAKIDAYLDKRMPVIARVDFSPTAGVQDHFVLIIGKENGSYLVNDPWEGETYFFEAKYGEPARNIYGLRLYSGPVKEVVDDADKIKDLENKVEALSKQLEDASATIGILQGDLTKEQAEIERLTKEVFEARDERRQAVWAKEQAEGDLANTQKKVTTLEEEKSILNEALQDLKKESVKAISGIDLIIMGVKKLIGGEK